MPLMCEVRINCIVEIHIVSFMVCISTCIERERVVEEMRRMVLWRKRGRIHVQSLPYYGKNNFVQMRRPCPMLVSETKVILQ
jgi:hypothetical protein